MKIWTVLSATIMLFAITTIIGDIITTPDTIYEIRPERSAIYANSYTITDGVLIIPEYYTTDIFPPWHRHNQKPLIIKGHFTITTR